MKNNINQRWSLDLAKELYNIPVWGETYFDINDKGHMVAKISTNKSIDLVEVAEQLRKQGLSQPVLIRFPQILKARLKQLKNAFTHANKVHQSDITHIPFYPIKVNQQHTVIETLLECRDEKIGLEVGSKTELLVALGMLHKSQGMLICNGYKDRAYLRLALHAQRMGIDVYIVCENITELALLHQESSSLRVEPKLGVRIRLNSVAKGKWQNSGGRHAKFGLAAADLITLMNRLKSWQCEQWLCMIHYHMGSQISDLYDYEIGLMEAMRIYQEFHTHGFHPNIVDIGGGLGVDYTSLGNSSFFSMAYSMQEYASTVINVISSFCAQKKLLVPKVFTENGRAITAHHAMLMTNILEEDKPPEEEVNAEPLMTKKIQLEELFPWGSDLTDSNKVSHELLDKSLDYLNQLFIHEEISIENRAWAEWSIHKLQMKVDQNEQIECENDTKYTDKYYCNFSVFQSMPDVWGLNQIFPIVPLARLHEYPSRKARLHDLTCDSDGQIDEYAIKGSIYDYIPLHELHSGESYLIGCFLIGAYQEVLGDIHNLFGDTHAVNVVLDENEQLKFSEIEIGDCVDELLARLHIDGKQIISQCQGRLKDRQMTRNDRDEIINEINNALFGYTYLDSIGRAAHRIKR